MKPKVFDHFDTIRLTRKPLGCTFMWYCLYRTKWFEISRVPETIPLRFLTGLVYIASDETYGLQYFHSVLFFASWPILQKKGFKIFFAVWELTVG